MSLVKGNVLCWNFVLNTSTEVTVSHARPHSKNGEFNTLVFVRSFWEFELKFDSVGNTV